MTDDAPAGPDRAMARNLNETIVDHGGVRLRVRVREAPGPTLLLAHSVGCDASLWDPLIALIPDAWRLIAYDMRGHGRSDAPGGDYTVAELGADALAILAAVGAERVYVCGLSLGGTVAQWLALNRPERVAGIALADTAARLGTIEGWDARIAAARDGGMASLVALSMTRFFSAGFRLRRPDVIEHFRKVFLATPAQGFAGCCAVLRDADTRATLGGIACPTLVIVGAQDEPTPPADAEALAAGIAGATLAILPTGHLSAVEDAAGFADALVRHVAAIAWPGAAQS